MGGRRRRAEAAAVWMLLPGEETVALVVAVLVLLPLLPRACLAAAPGSPGLEAGEGSGAASWRA